MNTMYTEICSGNVTTRKVKAKMAASSVMKLTELNTSLIIDDILSQKERDDITKMLEEEREQHAKSLTEGTCGVAAKGSEDETKLKAAKREPSLANMPNIDRLLKESTLDELNDVLGNIGLRFYQLEEALDEHQVSLEFAHKEIGDPEQENKQLKEKIEELGIEGKRNEYQVNALEDKFERLDTIVRKKNLVLEGVRESD